MKWFYNWSGGVVFWIGVALCFAFPIGTIVGIILIFYSVSLGKEAEEIEDKENRLKREKNTETLVKVFDEKEYLKDFKKGLMNNPLSSETENFFNDLDGYWDNYTNNTSEHRLYKGFNVDKNYNKCLEVHLDTFENNYENNVYSYFYDHLNKEYTWTDDSKFEVSQILFNKVKNYRDICDFLDREYVPELIEDWEKEKKNQKERIFEQKQKLNEENLIEEKKWDFIKELLSEKSNSKMERGLLTEHVRQVFNKQYGDWIQLQRIKGVWSVTLNGKVKKLKLL